MAKTHQDYKHSINKHLRVLQRLVLQTMNYEPSCAFNNQRYHKTPKAATKTQLCK